MRRMLIGYACAALLVSSAAAQTFNYEYDVLGRLVRVERSTGASTRVRYHYDSVDNRTKVKQGVSAPTAVSDYAFIENSLGPYEIWPLDNDTDADFPYDSLVITGVSGTGSGYATIMGGGSHLYFSAPDGSYSFSYSIQDADGQTASGTISVDVMTICWWC